MARQTIILGAGCFWGVQYYFDQVPGVLETEVGYIGGKTQSPSYEEVCNHGTGHAEAVRVVFDDSKIQLEGVLNHFFRIHDPTQLNKQGPDVGDQYRSAIFYQDDNQKNSALKAIDLLSESGQYKHPVVTTLEPSTTFWSAEGYHQKFTERTGRGMCHVPYTKLKAKS
jgi:methionine-S-sulfoxide reductase